MTPRDVAVSAPVAYLFMIWAGHTYALDQLEPLCQLLSERFAGELWSCGSCDADVECGRIHLHIVKDLSGHRIANFVSFARRVVTRARELREAGTPERIVVTSYDPFKGGLIALRVTQLLRARFVCEVNGVFGNPDNFAHIGSSLWRKVRLMQTRVVGSYVLRRADAVRLLFPGQLTGFVSLSTRTLVRHFFALSYTERFHPGPESCIILSAGFPFKIKGVDVLVAAFQRIASRYPDWKLVLIGHLIPEELRASGTQHPQIMALPGLLQSELADWMSRCAILVLASRSEAMGRVLIEAAAAGKCRVATRVGGIPTVIEDGIDGLLVSKEDVAELAACLGKLIEDKALRQRLGNAARVRAETEFSSASYLARFEELIHSTLTAS